MEPSPHEQNRRSWNAVTAVHNAHKRDQAVFLREGGTTLFDEELELIGRPLDGQRVVHLQCNCGQDSLSLAALGANVTGVDIADEAIAFAQRLSTDSGIDAQFERDDVLTWLPDAAAEGRAFDVAFCTYGTVGWLSDIDAWARGIAGVLAPGGVLALLEFHPTVWLFDEEQRIIDDYFPTGAIHEAEGVTDYVGRSGDGLTPMGRVAPDGPTGEDWKNPEAAVCYQWTVAAMAQSMIDAGLVLEVVREYPHTNGARLWPSQPELPGRRYGSPCSRSLPLMVGMRARKP